MTFQVTALHQTIRAVVLETSLLKCNKCLFHFPWIKLIFLIMKSRKTVNTFLETIIRYSVIYSITVTVSITISNLLEAENSFEATWNVLHPPTAHIFIDVVRAHTVEASRCTNQYDCHQDGPLLIDDPSQTLTQPDSPGGGTTASLTFILWHYNMMEAATEGHWCWDCDIISLIPVDQTVSGNQMMYYVEYLLDMIA